MNPVSQITRSLQVEPIRIAPPTSRCAAVAAIICDESLLFIKRAERVDDPWSGHIALPGGMVETTDKDKYAAVVRETREEVGIDLSTGVLLGELNELQTRPRLPPMTISPFVFNMSGVPFEPQLNYEVQDILFHPLHALLDPSSRSSFQYRWKGHDVTLPCIDLPFGRLWGLTLKIVDDLLVRARSGSR